MRNTFWQRCSALLAGERSGRRQGLSVVCDACPDAPGAAGCRERGEELGGGGSPGFAFICIPTGCWAESLGMGKKTLSVQLKSDGKVKLTPLFCFVC